MFPVHNNKVLRIVNNQLNLKPGCIVEYLHSNQLNIGSILSTEKNLTLITQQNRTIKITKSRILPWIGPYLKQDLLRQDILDKMQIIHAEREKIKSKINTEEIWQLVHEEVEECTVHWLAELLWETPDANHVAGLGRALVEDKIHFKFVNPNFKIFSPDIVENKLNQLKQAEIERKIIDAGRRFFSILWEKRQNPKVELPHLEENIRNELVLFLKKGIANPDNKGFQSKWKKLTQDIPDQPHLPLILAQIWNLVPKHYNYLLDQADYKWGDEWSEKFKQEIQKIKDNFYRTQGNPEQIPFISIDSASTKDIDDAFYIEGTEETGYTLYLAFAYPILGWQFETELDKEVAKRTSSLYLPEGTTHMLPEELGTDLFSLHAKKIKPGLIIKIDLSPSGTIKSYELKKSWIKVASNLTYKEVESLIEQKKDPQLIRAHKIAERLREQRLEKGAVIIERLEPIIVLTPMQDDYEIDLIQPEPYNKAQLIVSEFMILANSIAAKWAQTQDIPLIFRNQDITLPRESSGVWRDPVKIYGVIKLLSATTIETIPRPHASLGTEGYAPITSPLRRYIDFLNIAQIDRALGGNAPWSKEKLESMLPYLSVRLQEATKIQKFRTRYWKLLYLKRYSKKKNWQAIVVDRDPQNYTMILPIEQLLVKVPQSLFRGEVFLGKKFWLRFNKIDPLNNIIKIKKVEEETWNN
ncbi:ribonuclease catalytic domain-containing protein [Desulfothermus naphthae]